MTELLHQSNPPEKSPFRDKRQSTIYERMLRLLGISVATYWRDACDISNNQDYKTKAPLVFHLLREIESSFRDAVETKEEVEARDAKKSCKSKGGGHKASIDNVASRLGVQNHELIEKWKTNTKPVVYTHRSGLHTLRVFNQEVWDFYERLLDFLLDRYEATYIEYEKTVDKLVLINTPNESDVSELTHKVPHSFIALKRFFDKLESPNWIVRLKESGYFDLSNLDPEGKYEWFSPWPQSEYLVRMSLKEPELVAKVFASFETNHPRVFIDMMRAALNMSHSIAADMVASSYVLANLSWMKYPESETSDGIVHLIKGGQVLTALKIMNVVFALKKGNKSRLHEAESALGASEWHYQAALKKSISALREVDVDAGFHFLIMLLQQACDLQDRTSPDDASSFWLPAIEPNKQNQYSTSIEVIIIFALRDYAEYLLNQDNKRLETIIHELESKNWKVFRRIALHLLVQFGASDLRLVSERLLPFESLEDQDLVHEYTRLLKAHFSRLSDEDRSKFLQLIDIGPDFNYVEDDEGKEQRKRYWQRNKLSVIRETLPETYSDLLIELEAKLGLADESSEYSHYMQSWEGPQSPLSLDELRALKFDELIEYLKQFEGAAPREWAPTEEGLGRELRKLIAEQPNFFSANAMAFSELSPTYVRAFVAGIKDGRKTDSDIDWPQLLSLFEWVVKQPRGEDKVDQGILERDPHWGWTRQAIGELIQDGLLEKTNKLIPNHRIQVWNLIGQLINDPDPIPDRDAEPNDYLTLSINTVRGYAFECVMRYMERTIIVLQSYASEHSPEIRLGYVPEAVQFLREFVNMSTSPMNRYQLGRWFSTIYRFSHEFAKDLKPSLFADKFSLVSLREAAWEGYSTHQLPNEDLFKMLRVNYEWAIEHYNTPTDENVGLRTDPFANLGCHLAYLFLDSRVNSTDSLIVKFYTKSDDRVNEYVWEFVAKRANGKEEVSPLEKIQEFWEMRFSIISRQAKLHEKELGSFGWMALAEDLDPKWFLSKLLQVLELTPAIEPEHFVVKRLAELSDTFTKECLQSIEKIIFREQFTVWYIEDEARIIFSKALASDDPELARRAKEIIIRLIAHGAEKYRDLL